MNISSPLGADSFQGPRAFARWALNGNSLKFRPLQHELSFDSRCVMELILFRDGPWQIELIIMPPNLNAPEHRHPRCSSADLLLAGSGLAHIESRTFLVEPKAAPLLAQLRTLGPREWHHGYAGEKGCVFLSFQKWEGEPTFIGNDWEASK